MRPHPPPQGNQTEAARLGWQPGVTTSRSPFKPALTQASHNGPSNGYSPEGGSHGGEAGAHGAPSCNGVFTDEPGGARGGEFPMEYTAHDYPERHAQYRIQPGR